MGRKNDKNALNTVLSLFSFQQVNMSLRFGPRFQKMTRGVRYTGF